MRDLTNDNIVQYSKNGINYIQFKILNELNIKHAYSLKSEGINFRHSGNFELEKECYRKICDAIGLDFKNVSKPKQNHTNNVKVIDKVYDTEELQEIDGLMTNKKKIILATTNADCILYLFYDKKNKVIANVHSGWRGSYQRIAENAIDKMINEYNTDPKDVIVCVCPSIRKCCFEVDEDVKDLFYDRFSFLDNIKDFILSGYKDEKFFIDTIGINNCLLERKGILKENIFDSNICSVCNSDLINSYRTEGKDYRLATAIISL